MTPIHHTMHTLFRAPQYVYQMEMLNESAIYIFMWLSSVTVMPNQWPITDQLNKAYVNS